MKKYLDNISGSAGLTVIHNERNLGPSACRNLAARQAKGRYIFWADSDNVYLPTCLKTLVAIAEREAWDVVVSCLNRFEGQGEPPAQPKIQIPYLGGCLASGMFSNGLGDTCSLWRTDKFLGLNGFCEDRHLLAEDWELFTRALLRGYRTTVCPEPVAWLRYNKDSRHKQHHPRYNLRARLKPVLDMVSHELRDAILTGVAVSDELDRIQFENYNLRKQLEAGRQNWNEVWLGLTAAKKEDAE